MAEQNFTYESVFRHLRTGLCGFTDEEIDRLENYCLALDIKGYKNGSRRGSEELRQPEKKNWKN